MNNLNEYTAVGAGTVGSDVKGNVQTCNGWSYTYDAQNRLTSIDHNGAGIHIHQHYDALNRIVAWDKNGAKTTQIWDNWNLIEEHEANDAFRRMYFHGAAANEIVGSYGPAYGDAFYFQDGRGNVTHLTGPSNNVIEHYTYFVSGQPTFWGRCAIAKALGIQHQWISTNRGQSVGMGNAQGRVPGENRESSPNCIGAKTYLVDHRGRTGDTQQHIRGVDKGALDTYLRPDTYSGLWMPWNQCNS